MLIFVSVHSFICDSFILAILSRLLPLFKFIISIVIAFSFKPLDNNNNWIYELWIYRQTVSLVFFRLSNSPVNSTRIEQNNNNNDNVIHDVNQWMVVYSFQWKWQIKSRSNRFSKVTANSPHEQLIKRNKTRIDKKSNTLLLKI